MLNQQFGTVSMVNDWVLLMAMVVQYGVLIQGGIRNIWLQGQLTTLQKSGTLKQGKNWRAFLLVQLFVPVDSRIAANKCFIQLIKRWVVIAKFDSLM